MQIGKVQKKHIPIIACGAIEQVQQFTYLGSIMSTDGGTDKDITKMTI